ncbi:hypothetical protein GIB67_001292 [Kingdonia uniflora]|uniref:WRC domain-containing protein n=1 Tax=Kingdonia uniflora TaxID=39325 RepID=A0A7J7LLE3_9MAGN|nr:hypothetical protein GIB67_001292 [Kingdonia uniflora]
MMQEIRVQNFSRANRHLGILFADEHAFWGNNKSGHGCGFNDKYGFQDRRGRSRGVHPANSGTRFRNDGYQVEPGLGHARYVPQQQYGQRGNTNNQVANAIIYTFQNMNQDVKINVPEFDCKTNRDNFMSWLNRVDRVLIFKRCGDPRAVTLMETKVTGYALNWWEGVQQLWVLWWQRQRLPRYLERRGRECPNPRKHIALHTQNLHDHIDEALQEMWGEDLEEETVNAEELKKTTISMVEQSKVVNTPGAEKLTKRELFDALRQELETPALEEASKSVWELILDTSGIGKEINETVGRVFCQLSGRELPLFPPSNNKSPPQNEKEKEKGASGSTVKRKKKKRTFSTMSMDGAPRDSDGAAKGNSGKGGTGFIIGDKDGEVLRTDVVGLGITTSFMAECKVIVEAVACSALNGWMVAWVWSDLKAAVMALKSGNIPWSLKSEWSAASEKNVQNSRDVSRDVANSNEREQMRCNRTDGKSWRCANNALPDCKYCEKHDKRVRRPKKHTETNSQVIVSNEVQELNANLAISDPDLLITDIDDNSKCYKSSSLSPRLALCPKTLYFKPEATV